METTKRVTNERSGRENETSSVAYIVKEASAQGQFSEGCAPRKTAEGTRKTAVTER